MKKTKIVKDAAGDRVVGEDGSTLMQYDTKPMRLGASMVVGAIRADYHRHGEAEALKTGRVCFPDPTVISDEQILMIARSKATLRGWSPPGVTFHSQLCFGCQGKGVTLDWESPTRRRIDCPSCEGDGFAPPMAEMDHRKEGS